MNVLQQVAKKRMILKYIIMVKKIYLVCQSQKLANGPVFSTPAI